MPGSYAERFRTHANYVRAFAHIAGLQDVDGGGGPALRDLRATLADHPQTSRRRDFDLAPLKQSLTNAWGTEVLLAVGRLHARERELLRLASTWGVIQAYYVVYHATQAAAALRGYERPTTHRATQNLFVDFWCRHEQPGPWCLGYGASGPRSVPQGVVLSDVHPWSTCNASTCWSLAVNAIRTTREEAVTRREKEARQKRLTERERRTGRRPRRARLTREAKSRIRERVPTMGFVHYLYRLRTRTNYEDPDLFVKGPESDQEAHRIFYDLRYLAAATLLVVEREAAAALGPPRLVAVMDDWISGAAVDDPRLGVCFRRSLVR